MKKLFETKIVGTFKFLKLFITNKGSFVYLAALIGAFLVTGCEKQDIHAHGTDTQHMSDKLMNTDDQFRKSYNRLGWQTLWELLQARAASAKYRNIKKAIKDGYADISVVVPNMGHHYMKSAFVDAKFEITKPEILVYNKNHDGTFELVAVEYAVPIDLTPNVAPKGFTGAGDVWDRNTGFGLWLLHAWVWHHNPDGVFNPTNPLVHLH